MFGCGEPGGELYLEKSEVIEETDDLFDFQLLLLINILSRSSSSSTTLRSTSPPPATLTCK
jgi:hypothetical protein